MIGRFTQEDVYRGDGLNLYAYVKNNPVMWVDPSGYKSHNNKKLLDEATNTNRIAIPGDADFTGPIPSGSWKLTQRGQGAHLVEKVNVKGRVGLSDFNTRNTPRFYPYGTPENAGQAHIRLHRATKEVDISLQGGNELVSDSELLDMYLLGYSSTSLDGIVGDLRTPNGKTVIGTNLTPSKAYEMLLEWWKNN